MQVMNSVRISCVSVHVVPALCELYVAGQLHVHVTTCYMHGLSTTDNKCGTCIWCP